MVWTDEIEFVFLPGLDGTGLSYGPLGEKMPENVRVTVVSYPTDKKLSYTELVQCAYDRLPQNKPFILVAESFSGPIAITLARSFFLRIKGIVFCATFMKYDRPFLLQTAKYAPLSLLLRRFAPDFVLSFLCGDRAFLERLTPLFRQIKELVGPEVIAHRIRMLNDIDVTDEAKKLTIPCCYIQAAEDRVVPSKCLIPFTKHFPNLVVKRMEAPHAILQAKPEECSRIIMDFARNLLTGNNAAVPQS